MKTLFIDRDGTIIVEPKVIWQVNGLENVYFIPKVISSLVKLQAAGYQIVVVSNQDGLGTASNPLDNYELINQKIRDVLLSEGITITKWLTCPHFKEDNCNCRKPATALVDFDYCKTSSVMIGDNDSDVQFGVNLGIRGIKITDKYGWQEITNQILSRNAIISRQTKETNINLSLNLDGTGVANISTGIAFFDHMLQQIAKHGNFDLEIACKGDLEIDEHHTIEDVAICLGEAYKKALGDKKGIARFADEIFSNDLSKKLPESVGEFVNSDQENSIYQRILPLDESISFVSIDISSRPFCKFDAKFEREYCGDMPTEMVSHFFHSFAISANITLHVKIQGENTHHKIESCFKSFAKCLYDASRINGDNVVSTKGLL
ncbi:histidinol-phosphatase [Candidatus Deianiraea vastatrix]|uniref:Imidazoleglycerol-phosphate dehydratase n=1 Tax=Candidatus Deianiraea vastatrix TaxID=2163644 RepID=A0A5B8XEC0_9RICK|nr:histidinol-phosphatase [Candidatus Deianiraea vastatrix]QED23613.1 Histidine biosynthesis bifunctional protein HisB [Candidatus Deianiraea vastatrix]